MALTFSTLLEATALTCPIVCRVKPNSTARITAGAAVQASSSLVFPWNCMAASGGRLRKRQTAKNSAPSTSTKMMPANTRMKLKSPRIWTASSDAGLNIEGVLKVTMHNGGQMTPRLLWATARVAGIATTAITTISAAARTISQRRTERLFKRASGLIRTGRGAYDPMRWDYKQSSRLRQIAPIGSSFSNSR